MADEKTDKTVRQQLLEMEQAKIKEQLNQLRGARMVANRENRARG